MLADHAADLVTRHPWTTAACAAAAALLSWLLTRARTPL
jgi:ElaB/YqjD/DUF883 family membrane-anchored ribosome-binding protein